MNRVCWNWRRTHANTTHGVGGSTGASGSEVSVGDSPTMEARPAARDITRCTTVVIGATGGATRAAGPDDGLISAVDVAARGSGPAATCTVVKLICALLGVGAAAVGVEDTVSADTVKLGWVRARPLVVGVAFEPIGVLVPASGGAAFAVSGVADADAMASDSLASTSLGLLVVVVPSAVVTVVFAPPLACTVPSRGSEGDVAGVDPVSDPDAGAVVATVAVVGVSFTAAVSGVFVSGAFVSGVESCCAPVDSDPELDSVEPELSGSATATPGDVATAAPIPSATAKAPTRPT